MFKTAIVRDISSAYPTCISSHPEKHKLSLDKAREQHSRYVQTLSELGLEIIRVEQDPTLPDCCFIEDTAVIYDGKALITRMGAAPRRGETSRIQDILKNSLPCYRMSPPATLDGGDVIDCGSYLISGISSRTNVDGIETMKKSFQTKVKVVQDPSMVHLKSYVTYLGDNTIVCNLRFAHHPVFAEFNQIHIPDTESYAANMINVNGTILMSTGFPKSEALIRDTNFDVLTLDTSEFQKCEGALTCLSLRF